MTKELAEFLVRATEHCGTQEIDHRTAYSGRGMYGQTTHAVVVNDTNGLLVDLIQYVREEIEDAVPTEELLESIPDVSSVHLRMDNMGRDVVIY